MLVERVYNAGLTRIESDEFSKVFNNGFTFSLRVQLPRKGE